MWNWEIEAGDGRNGRQYSPLPDVWHQPVYAHKEQVIPYPDELVMAFDWGSQHSC